MKEVIDLVKNELAVFFIHYINILSRPKKYLQAFSDLYTEEQENKLIKATVFYILCQLMALLWLSPIFGQEHIWGNKLYLIYRIIIPFIFLALSALALKIAWKITNRELSYLEYFIIAAYQFGVFFSFFLFLNFLDMAFLQYFDPEKYKEVVEYNFLNTSELDPDRDILSNKIYFIHWFFGLIILIGMLWWFYASWKVYQIRNKATKKQSIIAACAFTFLMVIVFFIDQLITHALLPQ